MENPEKKLEKIEQKGLKIKKIVFNEGDIKNKDGDGIINTIKEWLGLSEQTKKQKRLARKLGVENIDETSEIEKETEDSQEKAVKKIKTVVESGQEKINTQKENFSPEKRGLWERVKENKKDIAKLAIGIGLVGISGGAAAAPIFTGMTIGTYLTGAPILVGAGLAKAGTIGAIGTGIYGSVIIGRLYEKLKGKQKSEEPSKPEQTEEETPEPTPEQSEEPSGSKQSKEEIRTDVDILENLENLTDNEKRIIEQARIQAGNIESGEQVEALENLENLTEEEEEEEEEERIKDAKDKFGK